MDEKHSVLFQKLLIELTFEKMVDNRMKVSRIKKRCSNDKCPSNSNDTLYYHLESFSKIIFIRRHIIRIKKGDLKTSVTNV